MAPKAQAQAQRKSTSNAVASKPKPQPSDRRKTQPAATSRDDAEMPMPSSQRSEADSQEGIKAQTKFARDLLKGTMQRCAAVHDGIKEADDELKSMMQSIEQACIAKEGTFAKAFQAQFAAVDQASATTARKRRSDGSAVQPATFSKEQLRHMTKNLLTGCASLEEQYTNAVRIVQESKQEAELGTAWDQGVVYLTDTLKAGARAAQKSIVMTTSTAQPSEIATRLTVEEADAVNALGLSAVYAETLKGDIYQLLSNGHGGLKKLTRSLPLDSADVVMTEQ